MKILQRDWLIFTITYVVALVLLLHYMLSVYVISSDQLAEYQLYLMAIEKGHWIYVVDNIVNTCPLVTVVPAMLQRVSHIDKELLFKIYPCVFYALYPAFVYLIARKYMGLWYSVLAAGIILANPYMLWYPAIGRVGVALGITAALLYFLLQGYGWWAALFGFLLVFAHYGTVFIITGGLVIVCFYCVFRKNRNVEFHRYASVTILMLLLILVWHFGIAQESGRYARGFIASAENSALAAIPQIPSNDIVKTPPPSELEEPITSAGMPSFYSLESRGRVVYIAFGGEWGQMNFARKIELVWSWLVVLAVTLGLLVAVKKKRVSDVYMILAIYLYAMILITLIIPYVAIAYGITRTYFTALVLLAPLFIIGLRDIARRTRMPAYILPIAILVPYSLATSGLLHRLFGILK